MHTRRTALLAGLLLVACGGGAPAPADKPAAAQAPAAPAKAEEPAKVAAAPEAKHEEEDKARKESIEARNQLDTLVYGTKKLVQENTAKLADSDKLMIEEALKEAEEVLERNREGGNAEELRGAFEKLQASAHKLAEAMYKQSGGGEAPSGDAGGGEQPKNDDVIDAEFEDK